MRNKLWLSVFVLPFLLTAGVGQAADKKPVAANKEAEMEPGKPIYGSPAPKRWLGNHPPQSIFPFQGKDCPAGSVPYVGPEQIEMQKIGYVYCYFQRRYAWFRVDKKTDKCPDGSPTVKAGIEREDRIWCDMPNAQFNGRGLYLGASAEEVEKSRAGAAKAGTSLPSAPSGNPDDLPLKGVAKPDVSKQNTKELPDLLKGDEVKAPEAPAAPANKDTPAVVDPSKATK